MFLFIYYRVQILVNAKLFYILLEILKTNEPNKKLRNSMLLNLKISISVLVLKIIVKEIVTNYH